MLHPAARGTFVFAVAMVLSIVDNASFTTGVVVVIGMCLFIV